MAQEQLRLIVVGDSPKDLWAPVLAALAEHYELTLVSSDYPTWQAAHAEKHRIADPGSHPALFAAVSDLRGEVMTGSVFSMEARSVLPLALIARHLRMRFISPEAARFGEDEQAFRTALTGAGVPVATDPGDDLTVYSVLLADVVRLAVITRGIRIVNSWRGEPWAEAVAAVVDNAHHALGVDWGVTAMDVNVAEGEPRVVAFSPWLGERLLAQPETLPVGVELARLAAGIAHEISPDLTEVERLTA